MTGINWWMRAGSQLPRKALQTIGFDTGHDKGAEGDSVAVSAVVDASALNLRPFRPTRAAMVSRQPISSLRQT